MKDIKNSDWLVNWLIKPFLWNKERWSNQTAKYWTPSQKRKVPKFDTPENLARFMMDKFVYVPDPLTWDFYTHPEVTQFFYETNNQKAISKDCDDYACYAYKALRGMGWSKDKVTVVTIATNFIPNLADIRWCHVLCVFDYSKNGQDYKAVIDTNGLAFFPKDTHSKSLNEFDLMIQILGHFGKLYRTEYKYYIDHGYPFDED